MSAVPVLKVFRTMPHATAPVRKTRGAAGYDLSSAEALILKAGQGQLVSTGLVLQIPRGYYGRIASRSSLAVRHNIHVGAGTIDSDFRGEVFVYLMNQSKVDYDIDVGDRIAQMILEKYLDAPVEVVYTLDALSKTVRDKGGFGSTGKGPGIRTDSK